MISHVNSRFRRSFDQLPERMKEDARRAYQLFKNNHDHPSLQFKKLPPYEDIWSVRINAQYRAVGQRSGQTMIWFFIGTHAEYDALLSRL